MGVLFDQGTPVPIRQFLIGHTVRTPAQQHWDTLQNGELLTVAEHAGFAVFLTTVTSRSVDLSAGGTHRIALFGTVEHLVV